MHGLPVFTEVRFNQALPCAFVSHSKQSAYVCKVHCFRYMCELRAGLRDMRPAAIVRCTVCRSQEEDSDEALPAT